MLDDPTELGDVDGDNVGDHTDSADDDDDVPEDTNTLDDFSAFAALLVHYSTAAVDIFAVDPAKCAKRDMHRPVRREARQTRVDGELRG